MHIYEFASRSDLSAELIPLQSIWNDPCVLLKLKKEQQLKENKKYITAG